MNDNRSVLLFLGAPGAGKGTLASRCVGTLDYEQLSTGNLCREHVAQCTQIGKKIDLALKSGKLIDDNLITEMVTQWLQAYPQKRRIILDGYPRTVIQADALHKFVETEHEQVPMVIRLTVNEQVVIDRLCLRLICSNKECQAVYSLASGSACHPTREGICDRCASVLMRRSDDEVEAVKKRLKLYSEHESRLLDFYNSVGYCVLEVNAMQPLDDVFGEFKNKLGRVA